VTVLENFIYLDNSATTKPCETAIEKINDALYNGWGNPSSLYDFGIKAEMVINDVREKVADTIGANSNEIFFTSGGTESNNLAIMGTANALKRRGNKIITTTIEHPSVLNTVNHLKETGFEVIKIKPEPSGNVDAKKIIDQIDQNTILVSMMYVNNETGCILPVADVADYIKSNKLFTVLHSDCVQGFGKLPIDVNDLKVDLLTASGHKIHGPKGVGFIYKSKRLNLKSIIFGGNQEKGLRSGTESVPLIAGLGGAIDELQIKNSLKNVTQLHRFAVSEAESNPNIIINSPKSNSCPYILNMSVLGFRSETLLHFLESQGIYVSSGSACSKGKGSHVLFEMGLDSNRTDSALRISFSKHTTPDDITVFFNALNKATSTLKRK
jgi:cysteine desulfurase